MAPASATPTAGASEYKTASKAVVTAIEPAASAASTKKDNNYVYIRVPREKVAPVDTGRTETAVSYTHLRAHETRHDLVCRLLLEKKKN